jgi:hypothetical protein
MSNREEKDCPKSKAGKGIGKDCDGIREGIFIGKKTRSIALAYGALVCILNAVLPATLQASY